MQKALKIAKVGGFILAELIIGFFGLNFIFADFSPGETVASRVTIIIIFYAFFGFAAGLAYPRRWYLAGVIAWGGILVGVFAFFGTIGAGIRAMVIALTPFLILGIALGTGWLGARLRSLIRSRREA